MAMAPDQQDIFYILIVSGGAGAGEFIYDSAGNLRSSNVGQPTTDPVQGISCPQGFATYNGHGAVINLLSTSKGAFFQYQDLGTSTQGPLILSVASVGGTDPVTSTGYIAGMEGIDPAFGDTLQTVGANITFTQVAYTRNAQVIAASGSGASQPKLQLDAPEQTTASHVEMWITGASPDATRPAQFIMAIVSGAGTLTPVTKSAFEFQGPTSPVSAITEIIAKAAADPSFGIEVSGDTQNRIQVDSNGVIRWSPGSGAFDLDLYRVSAGLLQTDNALSVLQQILSGTYIEQTGIATPAAPAAGKSRLFTDVSGYPLFLTGLAGDTNVYRYGEAEYIINADLLINLASNIPVFSVPVGIGKYYAEAWLIIQNTTAADPADWAFTGPTALAPQLVSYKITTSAATAIVNHFASSGYTASFTNQGQSGNQELLIKLTVNFTAAGTLVLNAKEHIAGNTVNISAGSKLKIKRIAT